MQIVLHGRGMKLQTSLYDECYEALKDDFVRLNIVRHIYVPSALPQLICSKAFPRKDYMTLVVRLSVSLTSNSKIVIY